MSQQECIIAPSILSADFAILGEDVLKVVQAGADWLHVDVIDNHFAPNLTFGPQVVAKLKNYLDLKNIDITFDVHLMVYLKNEIVKRFLELKVDYITVHAEVFNDLKALEREIDFIKSHDCKCGLSINPETSLDVLEHVLDKLDLVLIMGVNPGFSGQKFINSTFDKIQLLHEKILDNNYKTKISVDGGVSFDNIKKLSRLGAEVFVSGSNIFGSDDYKTTIEKMRSLSQKI